jgi:hypothetical protein
MKKLTSPFKSAILLAFLLAPLLSLASDGDNVEKKRSISKSYTVSNDDKLSIENSFGDVTVTTWDKKEIKVDIEIAVTASSDEKAQQMIDEISVDDRKNGNDISFKTNIGNMGNGKKSKGNDQRKFYIEYKVMMPSGNPLNIENSFGKINIGDFSGPVSLISKFGELNAGNLSNAKTLHVEFGKANIGAILNPDITFKFNSRSFIKNISGNAKLHVEFCDRVEISVDHDLKDLNIAESYSNVRLNVPANLSANFNVHTNFGSFSNSSGINISEEKEDDNMGPKFDKEYSGNSGNGNARIRIKSSFGKIRLTNPGDKSVDNDNDNNSGNKNKEKNKNKDDKDEESGDVNM